MSDKTQRLFDKKSFAVTRGHDFIDINGVKWATCNLGAESPEDPGLYFRWGDKKGFYLDDTKCHNASWTMYDFDAYITPVWDDPAHALWGGKWRLPTAEEADKLVKLCSRDPDYVDNSFHIRGQNFNLKLPRGGYINSNGGLKSKDTSSYFWIKNVERADSHFGTSMSFVKFYAVFRMVEPNPKNVAFNIRPVLDV